MLRTARTGTAGRVRLLATLAIAGALVACGPAGGASGGATSGGAAVSVDPYLEDVVMGKADAPVTIIEYASLTCPHCRDFWKQVLPRIQRDYIETGKAKYILRDFPTAPPELAVAGSAIARCAGKDKYYAVIDAIFSDFDGLIRAAQERKAGPALAAVGAAHGLSPDQVRACVDHKGMQDYVNATIEEGRKRQLDAGAKQVSTPAVFVNDVYVQNHSYEGLSAAIESALNPISSAPAPQGP